jgi:glycosyltransferase involved in cell wall biosynthesis
MTIARRDHPSVIADGAMLPRISIVTPSYNRAALIEETIRSVLSQNYPNLEYVVIDGGSQDNTVDILRKYVAGIAFWASEPDEGQADAINKGFRRTTGDILAWINSDDQYADGALQAVARAFLQDPTIDVLYGACDLIDERGAYLCTYRTPSFNHVLELGSNRLLQPATFFRRRVFESIGGLNPTLHYSFDYDFWLRASLRGFRFAPCPGAALSRFRLWKQSKTGSNPEQFIEETTAIIDRVFHDASMPHELKSLRDWTLSGVWRCGALDYWRAGRMKETRRCISNMIAGYPARLSDFRMLILYLLTLGGEWLNARMAHWNYGIKRARSWLIARSV